MTVTEPLHKSRVQIATFSILRNRAHQIRQLGLVALVAGLWWYVSPWIFGVAWSPVAFNCWIGGVVIAIAAAFQLRRPSAAAEEVGLVNCFVGAWILASACLGYALNTGQFINSLFVGAIVLSAALWTEGHAWHPPA
jgi:hypothetical protein